jgi:hypothetical protein
MIRVISIACLATIGFNLGILECTAQVSPLPGSFPPASPAAPSGNQTDAGEIAKGLGADALRLLDETKLGVGRPEQLQKDLDANLSNIANAKKLVDELLGLLRDTASRLSPDGAYVKTLNAEENTVRDLGSRAAASALFSHY